MSYNQFLKLVLYIFKLAVYFGLLPVICGIATTQGLGELFIHIPSLSITGQELLNQDATCTAAISAIIANALTYWAIIFLDWLCYGGSNA